MTRASHVALLMLIACGSSKDGTSTRPAPTDGLTDTAPPTSPTPTGTPDTATTGTDTGTDTGSPPPTGATGTSADTGTFVGTPPTLTAGPTLSDPPLVNTVPLTQLLSVSTVEPTELTVHLDDGERTVHVHFPAVATEHEVPLLGLPAGDTIEVTVDLESDAGVLRGVTAGSVTTPAAPSPFPIVDVLAHDPARAEPGYLFFSIKSPEPGIDYLLAFDDRMRLVWWWDDIGNYGDVRVLPDTATIVGIYQNHAVHRDFLGVETLRYRPNASEPHELPSPFFSIHHELYPVDDGSWWALCSGSTVVPAYPTTYTDPTTLGGPASVADECIAHVGADGTLLSRWWATDLLDTTRIGFDSLSLTGSGRDWVHLNGVVPTDDGGAIVSSRHQGALFKVSAGGDLEWILADPEGWSAAFQPYVLTPRGQVLWPYHQHAPALADDGTLWVFDNHSHGRTPYTDALSASPEVTRLAGFRVDPVAMTVEMVGGYAETATGELYSPALGDADPMPLTGNILGDFGFIDGESGQTHYDLGRGRKAVRLVEMDPDNPSTPALDVRLSSDRKEFPEGWKMYRASKIPSLYPADVEVRWTDR